MASHAKYWITLIIIGNLYQHAKAADCYVVAGLSPGNYDDQTSQIGLIFVPGAKIPGEAYLPLLVAIQEHYPGPLWIGATSGWLNEMPNPIEIGGQISNCLSKAKEAGFDTETVFFGGHSLGGIVLESHISSHAEIASGIALIGTWLPDLVGEYSRGDNEYPVPVLTAIGELDGGGISYLRREYQETMALPGSVTAFSKTILVPQVNHAQVASGEIDQGVIDNDIDSELSEDEAHQMYGKRIADWLVLNALHLGLVSQDVAADSLENFLHYEDETAEFLQPFFAAFEKEQVGLVSQFVNEAQENILNLESTENVITIDSVLTNMPTFQGYQPKAEESDGLVTIHTYTYFNYDLDVLDFNNHLSASTVKAKMKLADSIYPLLGLPERDQIMSCAELNAKTMEYAMSIASDVALERLASKGRTLTFGADVVYTWGGIAWEYSGGIQWNMKEDGSVELVSARLTSSPTLPLFPGEHYCDLLSPYRALEWIYIESIRHKMQFS